MASGIPQSLLLLANEPLAHLQFSVVIPLKNEEGNVAALIDEIVGVFPLSSPQPHYEIILVDDASDDGTHEEILQCQQNFPHIRHLTHENTGGKSVAQHTGILTARSDIIVAMDGDGQNNPGYIPEMLEMLTSAAPHVGMVAGQRVGRKDTAWKRFGSRFGNTIRRALLGDGTRDTGCGLKVFRKSAYLACPYFDHAHRFMPALFQREGYEVLSLDVIDRPRGAGVSKVNNLGRLMVGIPDLLGVMWLKRRRRQPNVIEIKRKS